MADAPRIPKPNWERQLTALLPLYGHRNWIVVGDSAYPGKSKRAIETILSGAGRLEVARKVLDTVNDGSNVRANVCLDQERQFITEENSDDVRRYRNQLNELLKNTNETPMLHKQIIARLDRIAQGFRVLIVKTDLSISYTSFLFELGCS